MLRAGHPLGQLQSAALIGRQDRPNARGPHDLRETRGPPARPGCDDCRECESATRRRTFPSATPIAAGESAALLSTIRGLFGQAVILGQRRGIEGKLRLGRDGQESRRVVQRRPGRLQALDRRASRPWGSAFVAAASAASASVNNGRKCRSMPPASPAAASSCQWPKNGSSAVILQVQAAVMQDARVQAERFGDRLDLRERHAGLEAARPRPDTRWPWPGPRCAASSVASVLNVVAAFFFSAICVSIGLQLRLLVGAWRTSARTSA